MPATMGAAHEQISKRVASEVGPQSGRELIENLIPTTEEEALDSHILPLVLKPRPARQVASTTRSHARDLVVHQMRPAHHLRKVNAPLCDPALG